MVFGPGRISFFFDLTSGHKTHVLKNVSWTLWDDFFDMYFCWTQGIFLDPLDEHPQIKGEPRIIG